MVWYIVGICYGIALVYDIVVYGMVHRWYMVWWYMVWYIVGIWYGISLVYHIVVYGMVHRWYMVWYIVGI